MTLFDRIRENTGSWRDYVSRSYRWSRLDELQARVEALSPGDRTIAYGLMVLVAATSLVGVYALERSLLVAVPAYGGILTEGEVGSPRFINPLLAVSDADRDLATLTHAGLMGITGSGEFVPVLAEGYTISDDGKTYTFTLRPNLKFSDGTPLKASDVVFTVEKAQDPSLKSPEYADWSGVAVAAPDERTVRFTLSKPYAPFVSLTTLGILPARRWQSISSDQFPFSVLQTSPVGAGPFKVRNVSRDASGLIENVSLVANPYYALGRPYLDRITFNFYARSEDLITALQNGSVESAYDLPSTHALSAPYSRVFGIFLNQDEKQVFTRIEVRKALSLALDRDSIIGNALGGAATAIMGPVPPDDSIDQVPVPSSADPIADAVQVLTNAGWTYDRSVRRWEHKSTKASFDSITIRTSSVPELKSVASAVKTQWEKLGISINVELYESGDLSQNIIRPRNYEALLYGMVIGRDQDLYAFWDSQERTDPGLNISLYANKTVDTLLEDARGTADARTRTNDLQKIENTIAADYPAVFIYAPNFLYTIPNGLSGVTLPQIVTPADRFATVATWYRYTDSVWPFFAQANSM